MDCFVCSIVRGNPHLREHEAARWLTAISQRLVHRLPVDFRTFALGEARRYELGVIGGRYGLVALVVEEGQCLHAAELFVLAILDFPVKYRKAVQEWIRLDNSGPCYLSCRCRADYEFVPGPFLATTEKHQCGTDE